MWRVGYRSYPAWPLFYLPPLPPPWWGMVRLSRGSPFSPHWRQSKRFGWPFWPGLLLTSSLLPGSFAGLPSTPTSTSPAPRSPPFRILWPSGCSSCTLSFTSGLAPAPLPASTFLLLLLFGYFSRLRFFSFLCGCFSPCRIQSFCLLSFRRDALDWTVGSSWAALWVDLQADLFRCSACWGFRRRLGGWRLTLP